MTAGLRPKVAAKLLELLPGSSVLFRLSLAGCAASKFGFGPLSDAVDGAKVAVGGAIGESAVGQAVGSGGREFADLVAGSGGDSTDSAVDVDIGAQIVRVVPDGLPDLVSEIDRGMAYRPDLAPFRGVGQSRSTSLDVPDRGDGLVKKGDGILDRESADGAQLLLESSRVLWSRRGQLRSEFLFKGVERAWSAASDFGGGTAGSGCDAGSSGFRGRL